MNGRSPYEEQGAFSADIKRMVDLLMFSVRAVGRRRNVALLIFVATVAVAVAAATVMPRMYRVTTRVLTHKAYMLPALVSPRRTVPLQADSPTTGAIELIKSRDVLMEIIEDAKVAETWDESRPALGRLKDRIREAIVGPMGEADFREALLEMLDKRLVAYVDGDVVVMQLKWDDPDVALAVSEAAQKIFLDRKRDGELSEVRETLRILENNVESAKRTMEQSTEDFKAVLSSGLGGTPKAKEGSNVRTKSIQVRTGTEGMDPDDAAKKVKLERELGDIRQAVEQEEQRYKRRVEEADAALSALRQTLGPEHPDVQNAVRVVEERSAVPNHLLKARAREAEIERQLRKIDNKNGRSSYETIEVPADSGVDELGNVTNDTDPEVERALRALQQRIARYNEFVIRLEDARTELATAEAAFSYRYVVTMPPLFPNKPVAPNVPVILLAGIVAALVLAFAIALAADLASRRVVESWQVERVSGIPVLGTLSVKRPLLGDGQEKDVR